MSIAVEHAIRGEPWLWTAPTYDQVRIGWDESKRACGKAGRFTQDRMTATFPSGGLIRYRSLDDPDRARGHTAAGVVIDEASMVRANAWVAVIRPMLIDTGGELWALFTPNGRNWTYYEWMRAQTQNDSRAWQVPTVGCAIQNGELVRVPHPLENPDVPFSEISHLYRTLPERFFRQEILAEFTEDAGGVFRRVREATTAVEQVDPVADHQYVFGVDWGKYNDFTVIAVLDITDNSLVYLDRFNMINYMVQIDRLQALYEKFDPAVAVIERNSIGDPILETLRATGMRVRPFNTTHERKTIAIDALALAFEQGCLTIVDDPALVGELEAFEMTRLPGGGLRYAAPEGMHDDTVIALALAWSVVSRRAGLWEPKSYQG